MECGCKEEDSGQVMRNAECPLVLCGLGELLNLSVSWLLYLCNGDSVPFGCCADKLNSFLQKHLEKCPVHKMFIVITLRICPDYIMHCECYGVLVSWWIDTHFATHNEGKLMYWLFFFFPSKLSLPHHTHIRSPSKVEWIQPN